MRTRGAAGSPSTPGITLGDGSSLQTSRRKRGKELKNKKKTRNRLLIWILLIGLSLCVIYAIAILATVLDDSILPNSAFAKNHPNFVSTLHRIENEYEKHNPVQEMIRNQIQQHLPHQFLQHNNLLLRGQHDDSSTSSSLFPPAFPQVLKQGNNQNHAVIQLSQDAIDMCTSTLWHTLETTTIVLPNTETFVHTGDIDDLWLRDSAAQIHPLLVPFGAIKGNGMQSLLQQDEKIHRIVAGLIQRHVMYIHHDPYANAFRIDDTYVFNAQQKAMGRHDLISTWNYELDSACYTFRLFYYYWKNVNNEKDPYGFVLQNHKTLDAIEIMIDLWIAEQQHEDDMYPTTPILDTSCLNCGKPYRYPGLKRDGKGTPTNATAGLIWTGFRPSDDECIYGYLVPANMMAVTALEYVIEMMQDDTMWADAHDQKEMMIQKARKLKKDVLRGIQEHAIVEHDKFGKIYAYEVDGLGHSALMDDANVPSLLSIPYLNFRHYDPEIYANTRAFILSSYNPEYHFGTNDLTGFIEGVGSPHMQARIHENIWPMAMAIQGLTSTNITEKVHLIEQLVQASAGTKWMHESFHVRNPKQYTRSWFCWADSLFAELVMSVTDACPQSTKKYKVLDWRDPVKVLGGPYAAPD